MSAYVNIPLRGATLDQYAQTLQGLMGITNVAIESYDFLSAKLPPGWTEAVGSGGSSAIVTGVSGGQSNLITGAVAGGLVEQVMSASSAGIANVNTSRWGFAWRQSVPNAPTANTRVGSGLFNGSATLMAGVYPNLSATNFVVQYNGVRAGSALVLPTLIDTAMHITVVWHAGDGILRAYMDSGAIQTGTAPNNANQAAMSEAYNNAAAEDHRLIRDWFVYVTERS